MAAITYNRSHCNALCPRLQNADARCHLCHALDEADAFVDWMWLGPVWRHIHEKPLWCLMQYSGLRELGALLVPGCKALTNPPPSTFFLWVVGIYVALFGLASQRYENHLDRIENRANSIYAQLGTPNVKRILGNIPRTQQMTLPRKPEIFVPLSVVRSLVSQQVQHEETMKELINVVENILDHKSTGITLNDLYGPTRDWKFHSGINLRGAYLKGADLRERNLNGADLNVADLSYANLSGSELNMVDLGSANLRSTILSSAALRHGDLSSAKLIQASLYKAKLYKTDFYEAKLIMANLALADCREAFLKRTDLRGANLSKADLSGADLTNSDLFMADLDKATLRGSFLYGTNLYKTKNWTAAQLELSWWNEKTRWPEGFMPPCPYNIPKDPCPSLKKYGALYPW